MARANQLTLILIHGGTLFSSVPPSNYLVIGLEGMLKQQRYKNTVWCGVFGADIPRQR